MQGDTGEAPGWKEQGENGPELLLQFQWEEMREARQVGASLGLDGLNDVGRLWAIEVVFSYLVPGPGVIYVRVDSGLVCES